MAPFATILHVEDDPNDVFLLARAFRKAQVPNPVHTALDGQQAVDYLSGSGRFGDRTRFPVPGLVLLDLKLPCLSGFEVLAWARGQANFRELPIFVLSSSNRPEDVSEARALGANGYYVKTPAFQDVVHAIQERLPGLAQAAATLGQLSANQAA